MNNASISFLNGAGNIDEISTRMERRRVDWSIILGGITRGGEMRDISRLLPKLAKKAPRRDDETDEFAEIFLRFCESAL